MKLWKNYLEQLNNNIMTKLFQNILNWIIRKVFRRKTVIGAQAVEEIVRKKFNFIGTSIQRRGQTLYSLDPMTEIIVEVPIIKKSGNNDYRAFITENHILCWAINLKNAKRKLTKDRGNEILD